MNDIFEMLNLFKIEKITLDGELIGYRHTLLSDKSTTLLLIKQVTVGWSKNAVYTVLNEV